MIIDKPDLVTFKQSTTLKSINMIKPAVSDFKLEILNTATGLPLAETVIGNRKYCGATNERFSIRVTCSNLAKYVANGMELTVRPIVDGANIGYSMSMTTNSIIFDYRMGPQGRHALQFVEPEYTEMDETNATTNRINVELNKTTEVGTIKVELWQTQLTGQIVNIGAAAPSASAVHNTKKFFDKPNVASTIGEALGGSVQQQVRSANYIKKYEELKMWVQTPLVISVLKRNDEELNRNKEEEIDDSEQAPTSLKREARDDSPVKAEKKVKHEETFDLTNENDDDE